MSVVQVRQASFGLVLVVSCCIFFAPASAVPSAPIGTDTVVHVVSFVALAYTIVLAGLTRGRAVVVLLAYGAATEILQTLLPLNRSGSTMDVLADAVGIVVGIALSLALRRPERWWALPP